METTIKSTITTTIEVVERNGKRYTLNVTRTDMALTEVLANVESVCIVTAADDSQVEAVAPLGAMAWRNGRLSTNLVVSADTTALIADFLDIINHITQRNND